jgi:hypothetical protein
MIDLLNSIFLSLFILFIWFKTDAFEKYCKLFRITRLTKIDNFNEYKKINPVAEYLNFLRINYKNFVISLLTCVPCFNFWIVLSVTIIYKTILFYPVVYLSTYILYKILNKYVF